MSMLLPAAAAARRAGRLCHAGRRRGARYNSDSPALSADAERSLKQLMAARQAALRKEALHDEKKKRDKAAAAERGEVYLEFQKPFLEEKHLRQERDPVEAKKTALGQDRPVLPMKECYDLVTNRHPASPVFPEASGPRMGLNYGEETGSLEAAMNMRIGVKDGEELNADGKTPLQAWNDSKHGLEFKDHMSEVRKEKLSQKFPQIKEARRLAQVKGIDTDDEFDKVKPGEVASHGRVKPDIFTPDKGIKALPYDISMENLPPQPNAADIMRPKIMTDEEWDRAYKHREEAQANMQDAYDTAYQKWKTLKHAQIRANDRKGKAALDIEPQDDAEIVARAKREKEMKEDQKLAEDALSELHREMYQEQEDEQQKQRQAEEEKKEMLRTNLKSIPNDLTLMLKQSIQMRGLMSVAEFMREALYNPRYGFYMKKAGDGNVFGRSGDFVTSPEVSGMFGECIAAWCLDMWDKLGKPKKFYLVEIGGGTGKLMARVLQTTALDPQFHGAARIGMVDQSAMLLDVQRETIAKDCGQETADRIQFCADFENLGLFTEPAPIIAFSNELFDVFPLHKFQYTERGWCEWFVEYCNHPKNPDHFRFVLSQGETPVCAASLPHEIRQEAKEERRYGLTCEVQLGAYAFLDRLLKQVARCGGCFLAIDYGEEGFVQDSLRGIRGHQFSSPLATPGDVDLSVFLSWRMMRTVHTLHDRLSEKIIVTPTMSQADFLRRCGLEQRAAYHLSKATSGRVAASIKREFAFLTDETDRTGMGRQFKAVAWCAKQKNLETPMHMCPW